MPLPNMVGRHVGAQVEHPDSSPPAASPILKTDHRSAARSAAPHFSLDTPEAQALRLGLALRGGRRAPDANFDRFLPADLRSVSWSYWTPLDAAVRAAQWLRELQVRTVVDIGS